MLKSLDAVDLLENGASHRFFAAKLDKKHQLTINLDTNMVVTLADGSQVEICETYSIPIFTCNMSNKPVFCTI